jgi:hypothetical protein
MRHAGSILSEKLGGSNVTTPVGSMFYQRYELRVSKFVLRLFENIMSTLNVIIHNFVKPGAYPVTALSSKQF